MTDPKPTKPIARTKRDYELIVFGATSFVGQILTRHLLDRHGVNGSLKWAVAARSQSKLDALKRDLSAPELPVIIADAGSAAQLTDLARSARVIVSTVGPYALFGSELVKQCATHGTDYCDLTGEVQWIDRMIDAHEDAAKASGARIVHCCGFDSIPSDLGVWFTQQQAQAEHGAACSRIKMRVKAAKGGASGGTVASLLNVVTEASKDPALRKKLKNPYLLCGDGDGGGGVRQPNVTGAEFDADFDRWLAPFVMAAINTRVVHRSNYLAGHAYGKDFLYDEAMMMGKGMKGRMSAYGMAGGLGGFMVAGAISPARKLLEKFVLPKPGEGPTPQEQKDGFYDLRFHGTTTDGNVIRTKVTGDRDPGYGSTGKMLGEAAVCLAKDIPAKTAGGFWTPSTLLADKLVPRLIEHAGLTFERA